MKIFNFTLPDKSLNNETELYYRSNIPCVQENNNLLINKNTKVSFNTYFNVFSLDKYNKYTNITNLCILIKLSGKARIEIIEKNDNSEKTINEINTDENINEYRININNIKELSGLLYMQLHSLSDCVFYSAVYETDAIPSYVKVAAAICTFKREKYVYSNMERIAEFEFNKDLEIFIVDNGKTIDSSKINSDIVTVFKNKNYGGSGGFTRGLIEAYRRKNNITHVLLMDDDIAFDCNVIIKTISFLKLLKPEYKNLWISGSMLILDKPYALHEAGAKYTKGRIISLGKGFDLRNFKEVALCEKLPDIDYGAWWYLCMPISIINKQGLPLPLFIKGDDMEYGLRANEKIITLNGVSVWHESFDKKYSFALDYYAIRNIQVLNILHRKSYLHFIKLMFFIMGKVLITYNYENYSLIYRAYNDFLRGASFFKYYNEEKLNEEIRSVSLKMEDFELIKNKYNINLNKKINVNNPNMSKFLTVITLNGYLIPKLLFHKEYIVLELLNTKPWQFYKYKTVVQVNEYEQKGIVTTIKKRKLFSLGFKFIKLVIISLFKYNKVAKNYQDGKREITSIDFWCKRLNITNPDDERNFNE